MGKRSLNDEQRKLVEDNMGLAYKCAGDIFRKVIRSYGYLSMQYEDIGNIACEYLCIAAYRFKPELGNNFSTYAYSMISSGTMGTILRSNPMVKVPRISSLGKNDDADEVMSLTVGNVNKIFSINELVRGTEDVTYEDSLQNDIDDYSSVDSKDFIESVLNKLSDREKEIAIKYYFKDMNQEQIAKDVGVHQVQVSRLLKKIAIKLKEYLRAA